ncbi:hypothetical protein [Variovorax sp.]|uniref:hypothetical protein n=1 Tax=Variovorax sp. TaxID=1871043 RepID=UPI003BAAA9E1
MRPSPVQLLDTRILKIFVEPNITENDEASEAGEFAFADIEIETAKSIGLAEDFWSETPHEFGDVENRTIQLSLGIRSPEETAAPYKFEIICAGVFAILDSNYKANIPLDHLLWQAGLTMLFGRAREIISSTTSRMPNGELLLPTMTFMGDEPPKNWQKTAIEDGAAFEGQELPGHT